MGRREAQPCTILIHERLKAGLRGQGLLIEVEADGRRAHLNGSHAQHLRQDAELHHLEQPFDRLGRRAVAVHQLAVQLREVAHLGAGGQALVQREALRDVADVLIRDVRRDLELEGRLELLRHGLTLQFMHGLLQHPHVQLEADRVDVAGLLLA